MLGLAIAGGNLLTRERIARNKAEKETAGLKKTFRGDAYQFSEAVTLNEGRLSKYWTVTEYGLEAGRVYSASGTNAYGDIALLIGLDVEATLYGVVVFTNTESYGQTLEENYLEPLIDAEDKESAKDAVVCGATYGAKLCRDLINEAKAHYAKEAAK